jgi:hypothetical protein
MGRLRQLFQVTDRTEARGRVDLSAGCRAAGSGVMPGCLVMILVRSRWLRGLRLGTTW